MSSVDKKGLTIVYVSHEQGRVKTGRILESFAEDGQIPAGVETISIQTDGVKKNDPGVLQVVEE